VSDNYNHDTRQGKNQGQEKSRVDEKSVQDGGREIVGVGGLLRGWGKPGEDRVLALISFYYRIS
jgi:hypothetical protein